MTNSKVDHVLVNVQVPTRKVHGHEFPYYKVLMDNGTPCDLLSNKPRTTSVLYMCNPRSSNEVSLFSSPRRRYSVTLFSNVWEAVLISLLWASHGGYSNQEQGLWYCFTNGLNQSLVSSVAQAGRRGGGGGGYFRNFWVGICRWDPGTLSLYQS